MACPPLSIPVEMKASATFQTNQTECPSRLKKVKRLTYEAAPDSARVNKLCFQPAQAHPRIRHRRIHVLWSHRRRCTRITQKEKTKTYVFEVD